MSKGHYGVSFPFRVGIKGGIAMSGTDNNSAKHIEESIQQILSTSIGERVMEYGFGSSISTSVFEPNDESLNNLIKFEIQEALTKFEPRITIQEDGIKVYGEETTLGVTKVVAEISYVVNDYTNASHKAIINLGGE